MKSLLQRLKRIDHLISHKRTGSPAVLGSKVGLSERSVYDYLRLMKEMGAEIKYSRQKASYYYLEYGHFRIGFIPNSENSFPINSLLGEDKQVEEKELVEEQIN